MFNQVISHTYRPDALRSPEEADIAYNKHNATNHIVRLNTLDSPKFHSLSVESLDPVTRVWFSVMTMQVILQ